MQLYIANKNYSSWSLRPWVLMHERGTAFEEVLVPFGEPGKFKAFSPTGKVPCLIDDETVVWDSLAITEYLAERDPGVWPAERTARAWARSAAAEMHAGFAQLRNLCGMNCALRVQFATLPEPLRPELARLEALWNQGISRFGGPYLAGAGFTAVDAFFAPVAFRIQTYGLPVAETAHAYAQRLLALPSMRNWYTAALAETWRMPAYEAENRTNAAQVQDLREQASD